MKPRTRWQGWTLVEKDGSIVLDIFREPFIWKLKRDAEEARELSRRVVRCELNLIRKGTR